MRFFPVCTFANDKSKLFVLIWLLEIREILILCTPIHLYNIKEVTHTRDSIEHIKNSVSTG